MRFSTHLGFAVLIALSLSILSPQFSSPFFIAPHLMAAALPDIDRTTSKIGRSFGTLSRFLELLFGHRGLLHSLIAPFLLTLLLYPILPQISIIGLWVGYLSHLTLDSLTPKGIRPFLPSKRPWLRGPIPNGSIGEFFIMLFIIVGLLGVLTAIVK